MWPKKNIKTIIEYACKHDVPPDVKCEKCLSEAFPEVEEFTMRELLCRSQAELAFYGAKLWAAYRKVDKAKDVMSMIEKDDVVLEEMGLLDEQSTGEE